MDECFYVSDSESIHCPCRRRKHLKSESSIEEVSYSSSMLYSKMIGMSGDIVSIVTVEGCGCV